MTIENFQKKQTNDISAVNKAELLQNSVASVGTFKPKFNPKDGKIFSDELDILGTAFLVSEQNVLVTCAHVVDNLLKAPIELTGLLVIGYKGLTQSQP